MGVVDAVEGRLVLWALRVEGLAVERSEFEEAGVEVVDLVDNHTSQQAVLALAAALLLLRPHRALLLEGGSDRLHRINLGKGSLGFGGGADGERLGAPIVELYDFIAGHQFLSVGFLDLLPLLGEVEGHQPDQFLLLHPVLEELFLQVEFRHHHLLEGAVLVGQVLQGGLEDFDSQGGYFLGELHAVAVADHHRYYH